jgi:hypothetical protein
MYLNKVSIKTEDRSPKLKVSIPASGFRLPSDYSVFKQLIGSSFLFLKKNEDGYQH